MCVQLFVWDVPSKRVIHSASCSVQLCSGAFCADKNILLVTDDDGYLRKVNGHQELAPFVVAPVQAADATGESAGGAQSSADATAATDGASASAPAPSAAARGLSDDSDSDDSVGPLRRGPRKLKKKSEVESVEATRKRFGFADDSGAEDGAIPVAGEFDGDDAASAAAPIDLPHTLVSATPQQGPFQPCSTPEGEKFRLLARTMQGTARW